MSSQITHLMQMLKGLRIAVSTACQWPPERQCSKLPSHPAGVSVKACETAGHKQWLTLRCSQ